MRLKYTLCLATLEIGSCCLGSFIHMLVDGGQLRVRVRKRGVDVVRHRILVVIPFIVRLDLSAALAVVLASGSIILLHIWQRVLAP